MTTETATVTDFERQDLIKALNERRQVMLRTARELSDDQARLTPTASALCLGGIIKHLTRTEDSWGRFIVEGPSAIGPADAAAYAAHAASFAMTDEETLSGLIDAYAQVARRTDELMATLPSLDISHPLPAAPWFEPGAQWSARQVLLHIAAETAQHAGHADIIRETIDGSKSMG